MSPSKTPQPDKAYRAYFFDAQQRILTADWIDADSDEAAIADAESRRRGSKCEVWAGQRLVAELEDAQKRA